MNHIDPTQLSSIETNDRSFGYRDGCAKHVHVVRINRSIGGILI